MNTLNFYRRAVVCGGALLLLCCASVATADEVQDINKLLKQGQHSQALTRVNAYLANKPKDAQARFLKGLILAEQGKTNDAIRVFSDLTEDYPELPEPYNNLAVLYASQSQYDKARIALEMAIRTHPSYATAHENLGDIYAKMASQAYDRALQLDRGNTATQTKLALIKDLFTGGTVKNGKSSSVTHTAAADTQPNAAKPVIAAEAAPEIVVAANSKSVAVAEPAPAAAKSASTADALKAVQSWAAAWSAKDVKGYLAFYAEEFKTPGGESRSEWEAQRTDRISKPASIQVSISNPKVKLLDDSHASVSFKQSYRASHLKNLSNKTLVLVKNGGDWQIQEELSGK